MERLRNDRHARIAVLVAPAGYGKSSLLAEWAARDSRPFAWIDLALQRDEPAQLLETVEAALLWLGRTTARAQPPRAAPRPAAGRPRPAPLAAALAAADMLVRSGREAVLVLDDADHVRGEPSLEALAGLVRALPPGIVLALASRSSLRVGLGRMRTRHLVLSLDADDLTMTGYEAHRVLQACGVELDAEPLQQLVDESEGWPAGIHLAAAALGARGSSATVGVSPLSEQEVISDYVREEVFASLSPEQLDAMRKLSILDLLTAELTDAVLGRSATGRMLREVRAAGGMLTRHDPAGRWYRCHTIVRDVLRAELESVEPDVMPALHRSASSWFEQRGMMDSALDHAAAARDVAGTGRLLFKSLPRVMGRRDARSEAWFDAFTDEEVHAEPRLALAAGLSELAGGRVSPGSHVARERLEALDCAGEDGDALRACACVLEAAGGQGGIEQVSASAQRALQLVRSGPTRALAELLAGVAAQLLGNGELARGHLQEAVEHAVEIAPGLHAMALSQQALMDIDARDWGRATERSELALDALACHGLEHEPTAALTRSVAALLAVHRNVSDEAKRHVGAASRMLQFLGHYMPWHEVETRLLIARAKTQLGDISGARALLSQASRKARRPQPVPRLVEWLDEAWGEIDEASAGALAGPGALTIAELRVLRFLPTHLSFREIGERLNVSGNTIKSQAHAVYAKLSVASRSDAVTRAAELGLIDPPVV